MSLDERPYEEKLKRSDSPFFRDFVKDLFKENKYKKFTFDEAYDISLKVIKDLHYEKNNEVRVEYYGVKKNDENHMDENYIGWVLDCLISRGILKQRFEYYSFVE